MGIKHCYCAGCHYLCSLGRACLLFYLVSLVWAKQGLQLKRVEGLIETTSSDYISRMNYGFVAVKMNQVCAAEGCVTHTFHIVLPKRTMSEAQPHNVIRCALENQDAAMCRIMGKLVDSVSALTVSMRSSINGMLYKIFRLIPDIKQPISARNSRRRTRGLIDGIGYAFSYLFGTSTTADVEGLAKEMDAIKSLSAASAADAQRTREGFATFTKMTGERMDKMHEILEEDHVVLSKAIKSIKNFMVTSHIEYNAMTYMAKGLARFVLIHDGIQRLEQGVEDLIQGHLTPNLIAVEMLEPVLTNLSEKLRNDNLKLC
jgi:hypothetical protein